jgi:hypothetical protein
VPTKKLARGNMKKIKIDKLVFIIIVILIFIIYAAIIIYTNLPKDDDEVVFTCGDLSFTPTFHLVFDNETGYCEMEIGPVVDKDGEPFEGANVSIEFNNATFYNFTNFKGLCTLMIHRDLVSESELNGTKIMTLSAEGYDDMTFEIILKYP